MKIPTVDKMYSSQKRCRTNDILSKYLFSRRKRPAYKVIKLLKSRAFLGHSNKFCGLTYRTYRVGTAVVKI